MIAFAPHVRVGCLADDDGSNDEARLLLEPLTAELPGRVSREVTIEPGSVPRRACGFPRDRTVRPYCEDLVATGCLAVEAPKMWSAPPRGIDEAAPGFPT